MPRIETILSQTEHTTWQKICHETGKNSTLILREFIQYTIARTNINPEKTDDKILKSKKITISFTQTEFDVITKKVSLEGYKNPTHWLRSLVMYVLHQDAVLTDNEIHTLEKLSYQLWAIEHNLNQVTPALNANFNATDNLNLEMIIPLSSKILIPKPVMHFLP